MHHRIDEPPPEKRNYMGLPNAFPNNDLVLENLSIRAINACKMAGLDSTGKILEYYRLHGTFLTLKNCGIGTEKELVDLCSKYGQEPSPQNTPSPSEALQPFRQYRLEYLKPYVSHALFKTLLSNGIATIGDFYDMNFRDFSSRHSLLPKLVERLRLVKTTIHSRPERIIKVIEAHKSEILLPTASNKNDNVLPKGFIDAFDQILLSFISICPDKRAGDLINKRFGLDGTRFTLEEIGLYFSKSREWARQFENKYVSQIKQLIAGNVLRRPFCSCEPLYVSCVNQGRAIITPILVSDKTSLISRIETAIATNFTPRHIALLEFLLYIWEIETFTFKDQSYLLDHNLPAPLFESIAVAAIDTLEAKVIPCDLFELTVSVRRSLGSKNVTNDMVEGVISVLPQIVKLEGNRFELAFHLLNIKDKAYRILYEKQDALPYKEIWREITHRIVQRGVKPGQNILGLTNQMTQDPRFVAVGKSGVWALSEWNFNTDTLFELICSFLQSKNSPATAIEIANYVKSVRPMTEKQSIQGLLGLYSSKFARTSDGRFILKEWAESYDTNYKSPIPKAIDEPQLFNTIKGIFEAHNFNSLPTGELLKALNGNNISWCAATFENRINRCSYISKQVRDGKNFYSFIMGSNAPAPRETNAKANAIRKDIKEVLSVQTQPLALSNIMRILVKKGHNKGTAYRVISDSHEFAKTSSDGINLFLSLSTSQVPSKIALSSKLTSLLDKIQAGESGTVEFKSSLRWDYKRSCQNHDLEFTVAKAITGFLNTRQGTLFIGINDSGSTLGLDADYRTLKKANRDGFLLHLNNIVTKYLSKKVFSSVLPEIEILDSKEICVINIMKSPEPIYLFNDSNSEFYIRAGNSTHKLDLPDAVSYIKANW